MPPPYTPAAIHFGQALESFFHTAYGRGTTATNEIGKFLCLIYGFNWLGRTGVGLARSYHGATSQVQFGNIHPWTRPNPQCELADVLFVTFNQQQLRISFLQAKAKITAPPLPIRLENTEQYAVLSHKPLITNWVGNVVWSNDILHNALLPSVGSFGIFHGRPGSPVGFQYLVANQLVQRTAVRRVRGFHSCSFIAHPPMISRTINGFDERTECDDIADFGAALISMEIGTPIHPQADLVARVSANNLPSSLNARRAIRDWAVMAANNNPDDDVLNRLLNSPHLQELPAPDNEQGLIVGAQYVVLINSDNVDL